MSVSWLDVLDYGWPLLLPRTIGKGTVGTHIKATRPFTDFRIAQKSALRKDPNILSRNIDGRGENE